MFMDDMGQIYIDDANDQCITCKYYAAGRRVTCPLLVAVGRGMVSFEGDLFVEDCPIFEVFENPLRLV